MATTKIRSSKQMVVDTALQLNSLQINLLAEPSIGTDAATKYYVDNFEHTGGDVTGSGILVIGAGTVDLAMMANLAANTIIGNNTGSPATPIALSISDVQTMLGVTAIPTFVTREAPGGVKNGSNPTFTLAHNPGTTLQLFLNGMLLNPGATEDYTIITTTITMLILPEATDVLLATYHY
jgi:hypothetical protein